MVRKILCTRPWDMMYIFTELKKFSFCCAVLFDLPDGKVPSSKEELFQLFNSEPYKAYRKGLRDNCTDSLACRRCIYYIGNRNNTSEEAVSHYFRTKSGNTSEQYKARMSEVRKAYMDGAESVDYTPVSLEFILSAGCNLKCVMCHQEHRSSKDALSAADDIISLFQSVGWDSIDNVMMSGGEVFFTKDGQKLVDYLSSADLKRTDIRFISNAQLLDRRLDKLKSIEKLSLVISVDGVGDYYEKVRVGGTWEKLQKNLGEFKKLVGERPLWGLDIACVVMKTNFETMPELVKFSYENGFKLGFAPVEGLFEDINLFIFPWIVDNDRLAEVLQNALTLAEEMEYNLADKEEARIAKINTVESIKYIRNLSDRKSISAVSAEFRTERYKLFVQHLATICDIKLLDMMEKAVELDYRAALDNGFFEFAEEMKEIPVALHERSERVKLSEEMLSRLRGHRLVVFGAGPMGVEFIRRNIYESWGLNIIAAGDSDPAKIGTDIEGVPVVPAENMDEYGELILISSKDHENKMMDFIKANFGEKLPAVLYPRW